MIRFSRAALALVLILGHSSTPADAARRVTPTPKPPRDETQIVVVTAQIVAAALRADLRSVWVQYGPGGILEVRAVVGGDACPELVLDLRHVPMQQRATKDGSFSAVCWAGIPAQVKQAALAFRTYKTAPPDVGAGAAAWQAWSESEFGSSIPSEMSSAGDWMKWRNAVEAATRYDLVPLPLPVADPQRILVLGDTGCRIKGKALQDCSDPEAWPFARIAAEAARLRPDLVIHVGDYLYRENACPADFKGCAGTPFGDNWPAWDADFFTPAKPLLAIAPWVIVRGNHEDCQRAGLGFLRLLGPQGFDPFTACRDHLAQYTIPLERMTLVVEDNADASETSVTDKTVPAYKEEIVALGKEKAPVWWLQHRPIWGVIEGPLGLPVGGNLTMMAALGPSGIPPSVELMLAGHIHSFEAINYDPENHVPPQIVAGQGGDELDPTPANLSGAIFQGSSGVGIKDGISMGGFGFLLMTRTEKGWTIDAYDSHGSVVRQCLFHDGRVTCPTKRR